MKYFKVKSEWDQTRKPLSYKSDVLISNELYTTNEVEKLGFNKDAISLIFDIIEVSSKKTYFSFGARFLSSTN